MNLKESYHCFLPILRSEKNRLNTSLISKSFGVKETQPADPQHTRVTMIAKASVCVQISLSH